MAMTPEERKAYDAQRYAEKKAKAAAAERGGEANSGDPRREKYPDCPHFMTLEELKKFLQETKELNYEQVAAIVLKRCGRLDSHARA